MGLALPYFLVFWKVSIPARRLAPFQPGRMGGGMDLLQLLDRDLGVNLGRREFGLAKELLDN
jgi:hypothetical protein